MIQRFTIAALLLFSFIGLKGQIALPYFQDFEDATFPPTGCGFFHSAANADWERVDSVGGYSQSSACMFFDNFTVDHSGSYYGIRMPSANFSTATTPTLTFDVAYARFNASRSENLGIYYSTNGSSGWTTLANYTNSTLTTAPDQTTFFIPDSTQWETKSLTLTSLAGSPLIRLAFEDNSDHGNVMYIDNVHIFDASAAGTEPSNILSSQYLLYPNPSSDFIYLVHENTIKHCEARLFDCQGRLIQASVNSDYITTNKFKFDLTSVDSGIYFLEIKTDLGTFTKRVNKI